MSSQKFKVALKENEFTFGERAVEKKVKAGKAKVVFLAKDCKPSTVSTMKYYTKVSGVEVVELDVNANEVGTLCKKQFAIGTLCY
jgi:ribosomal protein L30E